jgi:3-phytase
MPKNIIPLIVLIALVSCKSNSTDNASGNNDEEMIKPGLHQVYATIETMAVQDDEDAADDPAIWFNEENPSKSLIIGTNKQRGLLVYNLEGEQVFNFNCGRVNNVDVRKNFPLGNQLIDIAAASNRSGNIITIVKILPSGELIDISAGIIESSLNEVYGFCLYHDRENDKFYAFMNGKDGGMEQWLLFDNGNDKIDAKMVRSFNIGSQPEGCVADDELGFLYVGEENNAIWKYSASPDANDDRVMIDDTSSQYIEADIEGLALYYANDGKGYLIASSQGNNTFVVYQRENDHKYLGSFEIVDGDIDGVAETDGIEVCSFPLGTHFPHGVFVAQDGFNKDGDENLNQNFKLVPWESIADEFIPALIRMQ